MRSRPRPRATGPTTKVRDLVYSRDGHRCVRCGTTQQLTIQHRVNRAMGGSTAPYINQPTNLLTACQSCNMRFEAQPAEAYAHGWKVRRPADPADQAVFYPGNELRMLLPDGGFRSLGVLTVGRALLYPGDELLLPDGDGLQPMGAPIPIPLRKEGAA